MSRLWIMRHGEAANGVPDSARRLTPRGEREAATMASWLARHSQGSELAVTRIIASPFARAQQTANAMGEALGLEVETLGSITSEGSPQAFCDWLIEQPGNLLVVSHMPLVAELTGLLVAGREDQGRAFPTAGIAELASEVWAGGCAQLVRFTAP
ncbi:phosphohistidine phosphatase SixA [Vreelandella subglaciescola]|jgi:phosphohistidine phosphatase|uniref:Phosphohistidine phosphatase, SixA n=1 Tax=Vreelandella subglaciescola TaxID=29571 RepID=A0A1M7F5Y4_9GAMM|nr:phosphohistidine phosphatase SixA [Halomonas subglaciescola]SHL99087.1 phosphohistidine phosphatase, SixA [Halomonas subglaciescola]